MARRVATRISLEGVQQVVAGFKQVGSAAKATAEDVRSGLGKALDGVSKHSGTINQLGKGFSIAGAMAAGGLAMLTKSAMDWQSAWAGVLKTVDGTPKQLATLEDSLRTLARTMPATHTEIAAVAEAAGQLGIQTPNVAAFTKTMIQLGETTNISAEGAASTLAQFMNIMGTAQGDVDRLGAALVALGNDGASTEADILMLGQRLAGTGRQMGLTEADVLATANAMSSLGIEAEAGGTAMSMSWKMIDRSVREGKDRLELLAKVSGMSAEQFQEAWGKDAAGATATFVEGLGKMQASGQDVNGILSELGMTGIRQTDTLIRLAGATRNAGAENDLLRDSLELGASAWAENSALAEEYALRAETAESKARVAWNNIKDAAITSGQAMLPIVSGLADQVAAVAQAFGNLPEGVHEFGLGMLAVVAGSGLAVGALTKLITTVAEVRAGLIAMGVTARGATLAMGAIGIALTVAGIALGAWMGKQAEAAGQAREYADAIRQQGAAIGDMTRELAAQRLEQDGALESAQTLGIGMQDVTDAVQGNAEAYQMIAERIQDVILAWEGGKATSAEYNAARNLNKALQEQVSAYESGVESAARYAEAADSSADSSEQDAIAKEVQSQAIARQEQNLREIIATTQEYGNQLLQLSGSATGVASALLSANETIAENGATLDLSTRAGVENQQALDSLAAAGMRQIAVMAENKVAHEEIQAAADATSESWVAAATAAGMEEQKARDLAASLFAIPPDTQAQVSAPGAVNAKADTDAFYEAISRLPRDVQTRLATLWESGDFHAARAALQAEAGMEYRNYMYTVYRAVYEGDRRGGHTIDADGSVKDYYARGGIRENHVAQLVPAGAMRVWAEPETGGEAYIPLAASKRDRSTAILDEVARRFGYGLVKIFADGGVAMRAMPRQATPVPQWTQPSAAGSGPGRPVQIYQTVPSPAMADYASRSIADELLGVMV